MNDSTFICKTPKPIKTSTPARKKLPRSLDSDLSSDDDEFFSPISYAKQSVCSTSRLPMSVHSISFTPSDSQPHDSATLQLVGDNLMKKFQFVLNQLNKECCLFETIHVNSLTVLIVFIELFLITVHEKQFFHTIFAGTINFNVLSFSLPLLLSTVMALIGIHYKQAWMVVPLIFVNTLLTVGYNIVHAIHFYRNFLQVSSHFVNLPFLFLKQGHFTFLSTYTVIILIRCFLFLKQQNQQTPMVNISTGCLDGGFNIFQSMEKDDDVILFERFNGSKAKGSI